MARLFSRPVIRNRIVAGSTLNRGKTLSARPRKIIGSDTLNHLSGNKRGVSERAIRRVFVSKLNPLLIILDDPSVRKAFDGPVIVLRIIERHVAHRVFPCVEPVDNDEGDFRGQRKYSTRAANLAGLSFAWPKTRLHESHKIPRTLPVLWQWSTTIRPVSWQAAQTPP
jgi:hypothetical protein